MPTPPLNPPRGEFRNACQILIEHRLRNYPEEQWVREKSVCDICSTETSGLCQVSEAVGVSEQ